MRTSFIVLASGAFVVAVTIMLLTTSSFSSFSSSSPSSSSLSPEIDLTSSSLDRRDSPIFSTDASSSQRRATGFNFAHVVDRAVSLGQTLYHNRFGEVCEGGVAREKGSLLLQKTNPTTGSRISVFESSKPGCLVVSIEKKKKNDEDVAKKWTTDPDALRLADALRIDSRSGWSEGKLLIYSSSSPSSQIIGYKSFFLFSSSSNSSSSSSSSSSYSSSSVSCVCHPLLLAATDHRVEVRVFELFRGVDAITELGEDLPVRYCTGLNDEQTVLEIKALQLLRATMQNINNNMNSSLTADWALAQGDSVDDVNYERDPRFSGYWLRFKGDSTRGNKFSASHDLLGRMDLRAKFIFSSLASAAAAAAFSASSAASRREDLRRSLRGLSVLFIGDSHVRTLYYGMLERLGVSFAANRVWRGGHDAVIDFDSAKKGKENVTRDEVTTRLRFVPSSFLDIDVLAKALKAAEDNELGAVVPRRLIVVAGVAQHHSTHCYTLRRNAEHVQRALETLRASASGRNERAPASRTLIWFGVPAQPVNRHLFAPKPVGQARRDCRSNARHLLYSAIQQSLVSLANEGRNEVAPPIQYLDAFALSAGLAHTSIDGAHFYSFVREAMLDEFNAMSSTSRY